MILKPKSVFFENENKIGIDIAISYENIFGCARFSFANVDGQENSKAEGYFKKGFCSALKSFARARGMDIAVDESKIKLDLVFIGIKDFDDRFCDMCGFFEKETEKVLADYFENNEQSARRILLFCHPERSRENGVVEGYRRQILDKR